MWVLLFFYAIQHAAERSPQQSSWDLAGRLVQWKEVFLQGGGK